jgi:PAS domain-containing protein
MLFYKNISIAFTREGKMTHTGDNDKPRLTIRDKHEECYNLIFLQSDMGVWLAQFNEPLTIGLPIDQQVEHLLKHTYLSDCNIAFVKMYGYDLPENMIGMSFTQLFDNGEASNLFNLHNFLKNGYKARNIESIELGKNGIRKQFLNDIIGVVEDNHLVRVWGVQRDITAEKFQRKQENPSAINSPGIDDSKAYC